jgi:hypothetical protein
MAGARSTSPSTSSIKTSGLKATNISSYSRRPKLRHLSSSPPKTGRIKSSLATRQNNFELKTNGWGTFTIPIKVLFKDNTTMELSHELSFTR